MKTTITLFLALLAAVHFAAASDVLPVPTPPGTYTSGSWTYTYTIQSKGTRSEGRTGKLTYKGIQLKAPPGSILVTPFGRFMHFGAPEIKGFGERAWMNTMTYDEPVFKADGKLTDELAKLFEKTAIELDSEKVIEFSKKQ